MKNRVHKFLLLVEVFLCFALPAYILLWGVLTLPYWLALAINGAGFALVNAAVVIGGCCGMVALIAALRYLLASGQRTLNWNLVLPATVAGVISIWTIETDQFATFDLSMDSVVVTIAPTLCAAHVLWLAARRSG